MIGKRARLSHLFLMNREAFIIHRFSRCRITGWALLCALCFLPEPAVAQGKDPCIWAGKKRVERYWGVKIEVACKERRVTTFRVYTLKDQLVWDMQVRNNLFHGPGTLYRCDQNECTKSAAVNYREGVLDGEAVIEGKAGTVARVRYRDGILDGPFTVTGDGPDFKGVFSDGVLTGFQGPPDPKEIKQNLSSYLVPQLREPRRMYREWSDYPFWKKGRDPNQYTRDGYKQYDLKSAYRMTYSVGFRDQDTPVSGNGIQTFYQQGQPKTLTRMKGGREIEFANADQPDNWQKVPESAYSPTFRPNKLLMVFGAGYGTAGTASFDFTLLAARFQDIGGGGYGAMFGLHRPSDPYYSVNALMGGAAFFFSFYTGIGVRTDGETVLPEVIGGFGLIFPMLYFRLAPPGDFGKPLELGLTLKLPLGY
jgi:hypothetical protein